MTISESGRSGIVQYREPGGELAFHWEFGGGDVVAIVQCGDHGRWEAYPWAIARRPEILGFVAREVVRQKAPGCRAEIDERTGDILLRSSGAPPPPPANVPIPTPRIKAEAFVRRYTNLKAMLGLGVLVIALIVAAIVWTGKKVIMVNAVHGVPLGDVVRTDTHIASLIQTTDPHLPEITGRGANTTTSISILLIPLDGSKPYVVPVVGEVSVNYSLARILGSDGHTLWFDATGLYGVRLSDHELITTKDLSEANASLDPSWWEDPRGMDIQNGRLNIMRIDRSAAIDVDPVSWKATPVAPRPSNTRFGRHEPSDHLAAGYITASGTWLGLHSQEELEGEFKPGRWIRAVEGADDARQLRRLCRAELEPSSDEAHYRIRTMTPISDAAYLNAAILRMDDKSAPLRLMDPDGALMIHTSEPGLKGTLIVSRVDTNGAIVWSADTGIDRFNLQRILPGEGSFGFVGTRVPVPDKLSEPIVVILENTSGGMTVHSLWR